MMVVNQARMLLKFMTCREKSPVVTHRHFAPTLPNAIFSFREVAEFETQIRISAVTT